MIYAMTVPLKYADIDVGDVRPEWQCFELALTDPRNQSPHVNVCVLNQLDAFVVQNSSAFSYTFRDIYKHDETITFEFLINDQYKNELEIFTQALQQAFSDIQVSIDQ